MAIIDIGGGTTDLVIFSNGSIKHTAVFSLAGNHVTSDISMGLRTPVEEAEKIKIRYGCALTSLVRKDETIEVHNLLRQLQSIRLGHLEVEGKALRTLVTQVPKDLNAILNKLGLLPLFSQPPSWAPGPCSK